MIDDLPALTFRRADWQAQGACRGYDPNWWHPPRGANHNTDKAKAICADCPVADECLTYAIDNGERRGIWGGVSIDTHRRRQAKALTPKPPRSPGRPFVALPIAHGTNGGYQQEKHRGLTPCDECREARNAYRRARRASGVGAAA